MASFKLQNYRALAGRDIFVDTNVLIYLFWPIGQKHYEADYAQVFAELLKQENELYIDFLVISEVVNRVVRIEYKKSNSGLSFKEYRDSLEGEEVLEDIYTIIEDPIFRHFNVIGKAFSKDDIKEFLTVDYLDFVDKAIVTICLENDLVLLTNDSDFKDSGIEVLSGNPRYW